MRSRFGLLTASSAALLAGCGGAHHAQPPPKPPRIPATVAARLAAEADRVAALTPGTCAARDAAVRFRSDVIAAVGRLPPRYQEPLTSAANDLAARLTTCTEPPPRKTSEPREHHGRGHHKGKRDEGD